MALTSSINSDSVGQAEAIPDADPRVPRWHDRNGVHVVVVALAVGIIVAAFVALVTDPTAVL